MATKTKIKTDYHIRWMIRRDMPEVVSIELESFEYPWYEEDFIRYLRKRNCIGMVVEYKEQIVGFMIYELHKTTLNILNFAVMVGYRKRGVASAMADKLIGKLSPDRRRKIALEVRETNLPAQLFFKSKGFEATKVIKNAYEDTDEDSYIMEYNIGEDNGFRWKQN